MIGLYPGSFDPITLGHLDLINRASNLCDVLYVGILNNISKTPLFTVKEREQHLLSLIGKREQIRVVVFEGLQIRLAQRLGANAIFRGVRSIADFAYEEQIAHGNKTISDTIETIFLPANPKLAFISSGLAKELYHFNDDLTQVLPPEIIQLLNHRKQT